MASKYSEAQKKAGRKWDTAHADRKKYLDKRSGARNFIKKMATADDIKEFKGLLETREEEISK